MPELTLTFDQAITLARKESASPEIRTVGALAAAAYLIRQPAEGGCDKATLDLLEQFLDNIQEGLDEAREAARG